MATCPLQHVWLLFSLLSGVALLRRGSVKDALPAQTSQLFTAQPGVQYSGLAHNYSRKDWATHLHPLWYSRTFKIHAYTSFLSEALKTLTFPGWLSDGICFFPNWRRLDVINATKLTTWKCCVHHTQLKQFVPGFIIEVREWTRMACWRQHTAFNSYVC